MRGSEVAATLFVSPGQMLRPIVVLVESIVADDAAVSPRAEILVYILDLALALEHVAARAFLRVSEVSDDSRVLVLLRLLVQCLFALLLGAQLLLLLTRVGSRINIARIGRGLDFDALHLGELLLRLELLHALAAPDEALAEADAEADEDAAAEGDSGREAQLLVPVGELVVLVRVVRELVVARDERALGEDPAIVVLPVVILAVLLVVTVLLVVQRLRVQLRVEGRTIVDLLPRVPVLVIKLRLYLPLGLDAGAAAAVLQR